MIDLSEYFEGKKLYGDDFTIEQIEEWYRDEEEGYFNIWEKEEMENRIYPYHMLNLKHGFSFLPDKFFENVLSIGGAWGDELQPIMDKIGNIVILESCLSYAKFNRKKIEYIKSQPSGKIPFENNTFDLITCFGVLHHIPNVSILINEMYRCIKNGGYVLIREPIVSMGDWRKPRKGLTKRERGIPIKIFREIITSAGFKIIKEKKCCFPLTRRLQYVFKSPIYNSRVVIMIDSLFCWIFGWNTIYHAKNIFQKLRPTSVAYVLKK